VGVLFALPRDDDAKSPTVLRGRTERGAPIEMVIVDGKLHSVAATVRVWCPAQRVWRKWRWHPTDGVSGTFARHGSSFTVRERSSQPDARPPMVLISELRGRFEDGDESARGTIHGRWLWSGFVCEARVPFTAD
jgi:hypothetical protein